MFHVVHILYILYVLPIETINDTVHWRGHSELTEYISAGDDVQYGERVTVDTGVRILEADGLQKISHVPHMNTSFSYRVRLCPMQQIIIYK